MCRWGRGWPMTIGEERRKTVTALFADIVGSTALGESLDPEPLQQLMVRYFEQMAGAVRHHGGTVEKFIGDAVMAIFGIPRAHEDDALRAVRAAAEIQEQVKAAADGARVPLTFRIGLNTGEVVVGRGRTIATGDAVNVAARLQQAADPGQMLPGAETLDLVRNAVVVEALAPLSVKGKASAVSVFRLVDVDPAAPGVARRHDAPFV